MKKTPLRILWLCALLAAMPMLWAAPTKLLVEIHAESGTIADNLDKLCEQAVNMQSPKQAVALIDALYKPMLAMVRLDAKANALSHQDGNADDKELWRELLDNLRRMGISLQAIENELGRFEDDPDVQEAYEELDRKMTIEMEKIQE